MLFLFSNHVSPHTCSSFVASTRFASGRRISRSWLSVPAHFLRQITLHIVVLLVYYDKKDEGKSVMQLPFHQDQRWSRKGKFQSTPNSQKKDTPTVVLTLGDARKLHMQCFRDSNGCGSMRVYGKFSADEFVQTHDSLFELGPRDEETKLRHLFDSFNSTYFKHGGILFGKGLSIGIALRTVTNTQPVDSATGRLSNNSAPRPSTMTWCCIPVRRMTSAGDETRTN